MKPKGLASSVGLHSSSAGDLALLGDAASHAHVTHTTARTLGFAICGVGRAGHIHCNVLGARTDVRLRWLVDVHLESLPVDDGGRSMTTPSKTTELADALSDPSVDCVIISTPTPSHAPLIRAALTAGKHVFAEKLTCCDPSPSPSPSPSRRQACLR